MSGISTPDMIELKIAMLLALIGALLLSMRLTAAPTPDNQHAAL